MKPLRVAMISYHTCPLASFEGKETGGMNVYVLELSRELGKLGLEIDIFTRSQDLKQPHLGNISESVRLIHVPAGPQKPIPKKKLRVYLGEFARNIQAFAQTHHLTFDLLHCHYYLSGLTGIALNNMRRRATPLVMTFHTLALMKNLVARTAQEKDGKFRIGAEFLLTKTAQKIIAASQNDKWYLEYLYSCPSEKIAVVTPGINTNLFKPIPPARAKKEIGANLNHKIVLFVGRIEPLKGIDVLMYAIKIILKRNPKLKLCLWIVGGDISQKQNLWSKELKRLERLRHQLDIATIVKFVGQQPQTKLSYFYNAAEVVVMPSHYESFGMVALEAMACGVPVIATNVSGITSIISDKQYFIASANNPLQLAFQIEYLLTHRQAHQKQSRLARQFAEKISWEIQAKKILEVYHQVLTSP